MSEICRDISALTPAAQRACAAFMDECARLNLPVRITETYRSQERQNELYAQGRTKGGKIVTWTKKSRHTSRRAWDIVKVKGNGAADYSDTAFFKRCGQVAAGLGISWGGLWKTPDMPHFEVAENWQRPKTMREELTEEMTAEEKARLERVEELATDTANSLPIVYHYTAALPDWARATVQKLLDRGILSGSSESDLNLSEDMLRILVINDRAGLYE